MEYNHLTEHNYLMEYTYLELKQVIDEFWDSLSDGMKDYMIQTCEIPFNDYVFSHMKDGDSVIIDYDNYKYEIINEATHLVC